MSTPPAHPSDDEATLVDPARPSPVSAPGGSDAREMAPGTLLGGRYRIVARLGAGGMGVVYRADDLRLGIPVALKLVGGPAGASDSLHARLLDEVRLAREVTHPNVCRVYDLGEADGLLFLTMEHVDGEDLASLLRRIGRLPAEKALDISRQLCAGLAAAHARGVLHRDLKPANVMLDGRGQVRILDFGLAVRPGGGHGELAGTPEYMAPEQLARGETSVRSDLWALGAVLHELFTGRRAYRAESIAEVRRLHLEGPPAPPSRIVPGIDPEVERAVLQCLEPQPSARPGSAAQVAAALPGGDPLAALVAAGETPSPELVAASGGDGVLATRVAVGLLALVLVALPVAVLAGRAASALSRVAQLKRPAVLADRSAELLASLGMPPARHSAEGYVLEREGRRKLREVATYPESLSPLRYWYRSAPAPLLPEPAAVFATRSGGSDIESLLGLRVLAHDPPLGPGEAVVTSSPAGRLVALRIAAAPGAPAAPPTAAEPGREGGVPRAFEALFEAAGLTVAAVRAVPPPERVDVPFDRTFAWAAPSPLEDGEPLTVVGATLGGAVVAFEVVAPWQRPAGAPEAPGLALVLYPAMLFAALAIAAWLARRNVRLDRADREGARKGAAVFFVLVLADCLLATDHVAHVYEAELLTGSLAKALFFAACFYVTFLALEPAVRRRWPGILVATTRLLRGRTRDPRVGRELLVGCALGLSCVAATTLAWWQATPRVPPLGIGTDALEGLRAALLIPLESAIFEMLAVPIAVFLFVQVERLVKRPVVAAAVMVALLSSVAGGSALALATFVVFYSVFYLLVLRVGALAAAVYAWSYVLFDGTPLTLATDDAATPATLVAAASALALAGWGFWQSRERPGRTA